MNHLFTLLQSKDFTGLCDDSRRVKKGNIFFSMPSENACVFATMAKNAGALAVVGEGNSPEGLEDIFVSVSSVREARKECAKRVYKNPFENLKVHAITGTNGKTTTVFLMREILAAAGSKVALLSTVCNRIGNKEVPATLTTPGLLDLYAFAFEAVENGVTDLVMEASSHALFQGRMEGVQFASALFSNLTQDHLDYHQNMENYFQAKKLLFEKYLASDGFAVLNIDDSYGERLSTEISSNKILVSRKCLGNASVYPLIAPVLDENGMALQLNGFSEETFKTSLCGEFNVDNVMLVLAWAKGLGISEKAMQKALKEVKVPGRFEKVISENSKHVIVDYAHTPDALQRVLETARSLCSGKLIVVFGCGGNRDALKRPLMGKVAEQFADKVFVTTDNPRTEKPEDIIQDIVSGMQGDFSVEVDRTQAIQKAISFMQKNDWLVVAGKGHEKYQIIGTEKFHFDDAEEILKTMDLCKN